MFELTIYVKPEAYDELTDEKREQITRAIETTMRNTILVDDIHSEWNSWSKISTMPTKDTYIIFVRCPAQMGDVDFDRLSRTLMLVFNLLQSHYPGESFDYVMLHKEEDRNQ